MKNFIKYAIVGFGGYLIGFYEMKYKVQKTMLEGFIKREENKEKEES